MRNEHRHGVGWHESYTGGFIVHDSFDQRIVPHAEKYKGKSARLAVLSSFRKCPILNCLCASKTNGCYGRL